MLGKFVSLVDTFSSVLTTFYLFSFLFIIWNLFLYWLMNIVIIPMFNAAVNIPNVSSNDTVEQAGSNVSATELKNTIFLALESVGT